jgi:peptide/nickel transport system permease protein
MVGVVTVVFLLFNVLPGDPARMMLGQRADSSAIANINKELGLDQPLSIQYVYYINDLSPLSFHQCKNEEKLFYFDSKKYGETLFKFNLSDNLLVVLKNPYLRRSYQSSRSVNDILMEAFPKTALLAIVSIIIALVVGVFIGVLSAINKDTWFDKIAMVLSVSGMALPSFFAAIIFAWVFAFLLAPYTGLSMFGSMYSVDDLGRGEFLNLRNLILPAIVLGIRPLGVVVELTRSSMLDVLSQDYIRTAKAKGLNKFTILAKHSLRNALNPVVTAISGWLASLMAGAVFVEYIFDWKGVGVAIVDALNKYDFPVVMGAVIFISIILVIINIIVDIIYVFLDPRIKLY